MNQALIQPKKALNKAYLKVKPARSDIERFKENLIQLLDRTNETESEEFHKNLVTDFLNKTYYDPNHYINTKGRKDLVIHNGNKANTTVGVIVETKKPTNKHEMPTNAKLNVKAFQELVLYYLRERVAEKNLEVKHLIITNINEWYIFDAGVFEKLFAQNKALLKQFNDFEAGRLSGTTTDFFYKEIAEPIIKSVEQEIAFTYIDIRDYEKPLRNQDKKDDNKLIVLYKLLSPEHLLKLPFANDSNSLDKKFYLELLHIIGLDETKEGGKKLINRHKEGQRHSGSILEDAIIQLDSLDKISRLDKPSHFGENYQERLFNVGLQLSITWINRILFLKLLEAQLLAYNKGNKAYSFLNKELVKNYDDLNSLFFQVLARKFDERIDTVKTKFAKVPYLNSSLFEPTELEQVCFPITQLNNNATIQVYSQTVLKTDNGKKYSGSMPTLEYLFAFLDAYDFSSEGTGEIQEENKSLISASVLGLIFEKINGYKDGSFFTPGFITMYMCRETIRKAVVQKFNEAASPLLRGAGGVSLRGAGGVSMRGAGGLSIKGAGGVSKGGVRREIIPYNPALKELARELRNNSTKSEIILWKELKGKFEGKYDFHRQKPLDNYIADFFCHELKLVIEIDGETHNWEETQQKDFEKECRLNELGINVLRFPDSDIFKHLDATLDTIRQYIEGFEKGDLSSFLYEDTPLNPLSRGDFALPDNINENLNLAPFSSLDDVYEQIGEGRLFTRQQANEIVNSIKICDPAVGSGHFLVSALNEMIAVKNDLKILQDRNGKRLKEYQVEVVNDELIVTDEEGELFEYRPFSPLSRGDGGVSESQRIQETLFHEKQTIIENCLFGVDINPNSVKICRLRLWIELLKNAYYKHLPNPPQGGIAPLLRGDGGVLETLPNIDINIKAGNSLVSRFALDADLKDALKKSKWTIDSYKMAVDTYRNAESKEQKREMERLIADIKSDFRSEINRNDKKLMKLYKLKGELDILTGQTSLFERTKAEQKKWQKDVEAKSKEIKQLEQEIEEIKSNKIFENAFEWRFEFPEVLNDDGDFVGFDVVIGNPPYVQLQSIKEISEQLKRFEYETYSSMGDLYALFYELGNKVLTKNGILCFITGSAWMRTNYGQSLRTYFNKKTQLLEVIDLSDCEIFDSATVLTSIISFRKGKEDNTPIRAIRFTRKDQEKLLKLAEEINQKHTIVSEFPESSWIILDQKSNFIKEKVESEGIKLKNWDIKINRGILTGFNEAFIIDLETRNRIVAENPESQEIIKPMLRGRDVHRYYYDDSEQFLIGTFPSLEIDIEKYPAIKKHLEQFLPKLNQTGEIFINEQGKKESTRKKTNGKWFETQDSIAYWEDFSKPKIIYPNMTKFLPFTLDLNGNYTNQKCFILSGSMIYFLTAFFNSRLFKFCFEESFPELQGNTRELNKVIFETIPVKLISDENPYIEKVSDILKIKKQDPSADTTDLENQIDQLVYELYGLTEEEIAIVENSTK
jgi:very-short-patch-repair endonuclease/tRNA1(Val) A37 N6-methylase TrmN6